MCAYCAAEMGIPIGARMKIMRAVEATNFKESAAGGGSRSRGEPRRNKADDVAGGGSLSPIRPSNASISLLSA